MFNGKGPVSLRLFIPLNLFHAGLVFRMLIQTELS